jgi:hypothetical protein
LQHLTLPAYGVLDRGSIRTPLEFLFSQGGVDVYSATYSIPNYPNWISSHGMSVILVYQEGAARQREIERLRERGRTVGGSATGRPPLDNLKFAVGHFRWQMGVGAFPEKWLLDEVEYYEPQACVAGPPKVSDSQLPVPPWMAHDLHAAVGDANWIASLNVPRNRMLGGDNDPLILKTIQAMQARINEFPVAGPQPSPVEIYPPCVQATQHLQVPGQIHLAIPGQVPPEAPYNLSFLFSQDGVDVYRLGHSSWALFVYQDEKARQEELGYLIGASAEVIPGSVGAIAWDYFDTSRGRQDWKPIVSFKYATFQFNWGVVGPSEAVIVGARFFAPFECCARQTFPNTLPSSQIGNFFNTAASRPLAHGSLAYRAALAIVGKSGRATKPPDFVLQLAATARSWVAVDADGRTVLQTVLNRGDVKTLRAYGSFDVTFDTRAVNLTLNGEALDGETLKPVGRRGVKSIHLTRADLKHSTP